MPGFKLTTFRLLWVSSFNHKTRAPTPWRQTFKPCFGTASDCCGFETRLKGISFIFKSESCHCYILNLVVAYFIIPGWPLFLEWNKTRKQFLEYRILFLIRNRTRVTRMKAAFEVLPRPRGLNFPSAVWPDVGIKCNPNNSKYGHISSLLKLDVFPYSPKSHQIFGLLSKDYLLVTPFKNRPIRLHCLWLFTPSSPSIACTFSYRSR